MWARFANWKWSMPVVFLLASILVAVYALC